MTQRLTIPSPLQKKAAITRCLELVCQTVFTDGSDSHRENRRGSPPDTPGGNGHIHSARTRNSPPAERRPQAPERTLAA